MLRTSLLAAALLATAEAAAAQSPPPPPTPPPSGGQLQQIPPAPRANDDAADLRLEPAPAPADAAPAGTSFTVHTLRVTGATLFSERDLIAASGFEPGRAMTIPELRNTAAAITRFYNRHGYILAQAYVPAQTVADGVVTIAVVEGRYGAVAVRNASGLSDGTARRALRGLQPGDPVAIAPLERRLLLLSDLPGVKVRSTLSPGAAVGTSDLTVDLAPGPRFSGVLEADNGGNRYTGEYRLGGTLNLNDPTGRGDLLSLRLLASTEGLAYGRAAYQTPVGDGLVGIAYTHLRYDLGQEFAILHAGGTADIGSLFASYPLVRSRDADLTAFGSVDVKALKDDFGSGVVVSERRSQGLTLGLRGDSHDGFGGGGWNEATIAWTLGDLDLRRPTERAADALTARTQGRFDKVQFSVSRVQAVHGPLSLYGALRGQLAGGNLDSSEKMELGGAYGVRAYPEGEAYGDQGYIATLEARLMLDRWTEALPGRFELFGFVDTGEVEFARDPWFSGSNRARRSGAGAGLAWQGPGELLIKATYARRLDDQPVTSAPDRRDRVWIQIAKRF